MNIMNIMTNMTIMNIMKIMKILKILNIMNIKNIIAQIDFQAMVCPARALILDTMYMVRYKIR